MGVDLREMGVDLRLCAVKGEVNSKEEYVRKLEEERKKIAVFRRELPLCMRLVADVIDMLKEELTKGRRGAGDGEVEVEVSPAGNDGDVGAGDKMSWMSTAQLWVDPCSNGGESAREKEESRNHGLFKSMFMPELKLDVPAAAPSAPPVPDLSLLCPSAPAAVASPPLFGVNLVQQQQQQQQMHQQLQQQAARKARRCWSPELHQKFVAALRELGGAQVATPKQIRELMKIDGLTNDEVKSHLQKYRLHTRRSPNSSPVASQPVMLVGGVWAHQEPSSSQSHSGSPNCPIQYTNSGIAISGAVTGEDEDGNTECYSWK